MNPEIIGPVEFTIPTAHKSPIGSYLSWPIGAKELTKALLLVPQIKEMQIRFSEGHPKHPKGKWPASFPVIEAQFSHPQMIPFLSKFDWEICVHPVPKNLRAEIREALLQNGLKSLEKWLFAHAKFSGRDSHLRFTSNWNSELKTLAFGTDDNVLPDVSRQASKGE